MFDVGLPETLVWQKAIFKIIYSEVFLQNEQQCKQNWYSILVNTLTIGIVVTFSSYTEFYIFILVLVVYLHIGLNSDWQVFRHSM